MAARQAGIPQIAGMLDLLEILDKPGSEYRRHMTLYPEDKKLPLAQQMARVQQMRGKPYQPKPGELGPSKYPERGLSYSDYAAGRGEKMPEYDKYGTTALGGTQGSSVKVRPASAPSSTTRAETRASGSVNTPRAETSRVPASQQPVSKQVSTNNQGRTQQPSPASVTRSQATTTTKPKTVQGQPQKQGRLPTVSPAQASNKATATQGTSQRVTQAEKPSATQKPTPVAKAEPSGEALSYFRKNKQSAGWDALGTAVSLVQSSLKPEKGGLKSRAEYDRLLRGSDNFKKLDGNEQQRVRQAFAQWMNEQTIFKGKA